MTWSVQCQFRKVISGPSPLDLWEEALDAFFFPFHCPVGQVVQSFLLEALLLSFPFPSHVEGDAAVSPFFFLLVWAIKIQQLISSQGTGNVLAVVSLRGFYFTFYEKPGDNMHKQKDKWLLLLCGPLPYVRERWDIRTERFAAGQSGGSPGLSLSSHSWGC